MNLFAYLDYREYLADFYAEQKRMHSFFSYRYMAGKLDMDPGTLVKVFQKSRHLTGTAIPALAQLCKFSSEETAYFEHLLAFNKARRDDESAHHFAALCALRKPHLRTVDRDAYEFYTEWYHTAIRAVIGVEGFRGDYHRLARTVTPPITVRQAKESVTLLADLGLIEEHDGVWNITDRLITTGAAWRGPAIRQFQKRCASLGEEALERFRKEIRDISTVTISAAESDLPALRDLIARFRSSLLALADQTDRPDRIYQLNIQLFPLSETLSSEDCHENQ